MPLNTEITREGEPLVTRWDGTTLSAMYTAAVQEAEPDREFSEGRTFGDLEDGQYVSFDMVPIYYLDWDVPLVKEGRQVLERSHTFDLWTDHPPLELTAGDVLRAYRS